MKQIECTKWIAAAVVIGSAVALAASMAVAPAGEVSAAPAEQEVCAGNLLRNPSFEGGSRKTEYLGTSLSSAVADEWNPWFVRGGEVYNREPEFKVESVPIGGDPARVRSGGQSMKWFNTWGTHTAGIYQRVAVPAGSTVTFTAHGQVYSGEADGWDGDAKTFRSDMEKYGNYSLWVGIDPTGAEPSHMGAHPPPSVVWSESSMEPDVWVARTVTVRAQGGAVTVYTKGAPEWPVKHNDSFWDDACLVVGGNVAPAPAAAQPTAPAAAAPAEGAAQPAATQVPATTVPEPTEEPTGEPTEEPDEPRSMSEPLLNTRMTPAGPREPVSGGWAVRG